MKKLSIFFIFVGIAGLAMAALAAFTNLSDEWKIIIPACIAALGLVVFLPKKNQAISPTLAAGSPASASSAAPATPAPGTAPGGPTTLRGAIGGILVALVLLAGLAGISFWLYRQLNDWANNETARTPTTVTVNPIGHDNLYTESKPFRNWINPGIDYNLFELKKGWGWSMFFDNPISYRVRQTGKEPFIFADAGGTNFFAPHDGWLEIKTDYQNNWLSATRRIYNQAKIQESIEIEQKAKEKEKK